MTSAKKRRHQQKLSSKQSRHQKKRFWISTPIALAGTALILVVIVGWSLYSRGTEVSKPNKSAASATTALTPTKKEMPSPATAAVAELPASVKNAPIQTLDGEPLRLADYAGKVLILDVWATWCGPCRKEVPFLVDMR